jgi:hypothetical protein
MQLGHGGAIACDSNIQYHELLLFVLGETICEDIELETVICYSTPWIKVVVAYSVAGSDSSGDLLPMGISCFYL